MSAAAGADTGRTETSLAGAAWLNEGPLPTLLALLDHDGEEARAIGGVVRNALLGEPPGDVDVATTALPQEVSRRAVAAGFRAIPTGIEHGTVTVIVHGVPFEVTTLREDVETFGRHAVVRFGRDWKADAERRDFTINALSVTSDGAVHDYAGGLADLAARRVRFIGEPARRIAEDYLRILRFFRFHAAYGEGAPDAAGLHASIGARDGLGLLSRERVRMELMKLLAARGAVPTIVAMAEAGLLGPVIGGVPQLASFANLAAIEPKLSLTADSVRRLGALGVLVSEDAERLWQRLRLSNAEHARLAAMAEGWWRVDATDSKPARALLYRLGAQHFTDRVLLAWTRSPAGRDNAAFRDLVGLPERWTVPKLPFKAADFMARGVPRGPQLGAVMRAVEAAWIASDFPADEASLARIAAEAVAANAEA